MKLTQDHFDTNFFIQAFNDTSITVANKIINNSTIITPNEIIGWAVNDVNQLSESHWHQILIHKPEVLIVGTGVKHKNIPFSTLKPLYQQQIGIEIMNHASACRTYNILAMENRKVIVALII
jgi:uncharacterized protein